MVSLDDGTLVGGGFSTRVGAAAKAGGGTGDMGINGDWVMVGARTGLGDGDGDGDGDGIDEAKGKGFRQGCGESNICLGVHPNSSICFSIEARSRGSLIASTSTAPCVDGDGDGNGEEMAMMMDLAYFIREEIEYIMCPLSLKTGLFVAKNEVNPFMEMVRNIFTLKSLAIL